MAIITNKKKWRNIKIGGKIITKVYKNGAKIYDNSHTLTNPVQGAALVNLEGAVNKDWEVPYSGWYRFDIAGTSGNNGGATRGGGGAQIIYDLYLPKGSRVLIWSSTRISGAPDALKGGNGSGNNGYSSSGKPGKLGGGGASGGYQAGGGGGGASGDGARAGGGAGGGGSGAIVYQGDDLFAYEHAENWFYLILCGGGGGGDTGGDYACGGAGGGGGSNGGGSNWSGGGAGDYNNLSGIQKPGNSSAYSHGQPGSGNVIDVRDAANPTVLATRTGLSAAGVQGWARIYPLY